MSKINGTNQDRKECKFNASLPKTSNSEDSNPSKPRKPRASGFARSQLGYWKRALRTDAVSGSLFVQIAHRGRRARFTFERNAETAAEKAKQIFRCIVEDGWPVAIERYSPRSASAILRKQAQASALAHKAKVGGRIERPTVGDLIRESSGLSTVRPATLHGYTKSLRFIASEMFAIPHTEQAPEARPRRGQKPKSAVCTRSSPSLFGPRRLSPCRWRDTAFEPRRRTDSSIR